MKNNKIIFPSIFKFNESATYFKEFIDQNKKNEISGRHLSNLLNWPISYMIDMTKKRKPLSLLRAGEFAKFAKFDSLEHERIIWIALNETGDDATKCFFQNKLNINPDLVLTPKSNYHFASEEDYFYTTLVCQFILFKQRKVKTEELLSEIKLPHLKKEQVEEALKIIEKDELIKWNETGSFFYPAVNLEYDNHNVRDPSAYQGIKIHEYYAKNFIDFINQPRSPSAYISGFSLISKKQFMPIAMQLFHLKNLIMQMNNENLNSNTADLRLMQFDLNLFTLARKE